MAIIVAPSTVGHEIAKKGRMTVVDVRTVELDDATQFQLPS
jgi:hypothetical protein